MLLQRLTGGNAVGGPASHLVVRVDGVIDLFVGDREPGGRTGAFQFLEKLLGQFVVLTTQSLARIEHAEEVQAAASDFHQFLYGHVPAGDRVDHLHGVLAVVKRPRGTVDKLTEFRRVQHRVKDFSLVSEADFFVSQ